VTGNTLLIGGGGLTPNGRRCWFERSRPLCVVELVVRLGARISSLVAGMRSGWRNYMVLLQANIHEPTQDGPAGRGSLADRGVDGPADRRMLRLG
jgi:hypothetical protein